MTGWSQWQPGDPVVVRLRLAGLWRFLAFVGLRSRVPAPNRVVLDPAGVHWSMRKRYRVLLGQLTAELTTLDNGLRTYGQGRYRGITFETSISPFRNQ